MQTNHDYFCTNRAKSSNQNFKSSNSSAGAKSNIQKT